MRPLSSRSRRSPLRRADVSDTLARSLARRFCRKTTLTKHIAREHSHLTRKEAVAAQGKNSAPSPVLVPKKPTALGGKGGRRGGGGPSTGGGGGGGGTSSSTRASGSGRPGSSGGGSKSTACYHPYPTWHRYSTRNRDDPTGGRPPPVRSRGGGDAGGYSLHGLAPPRASSPAFTDSDDEGYDFAVVPAHHQMPAAYHYVPMHAPAAMLVDGDDDGEGPGAGGHEWLRAGGPPPGLSAKLAASSAVVPRLPSSSVAMGRSVSGPARGTRHADEATMKEQWLAGIAHPQRPGGALERSVSHPGTPAGHAHPGWGHDDQHETYSPGTAPPGSFAFPPSPSSAAAVPNGLVGPAPPSARWGAYPQSAYPHRPQAMQRAATYSYAQMSPPQSAAHASRPGTAGPGSPTTNSSGPPSPQSQQSLYSAGIDDSAGAGAHHAHHAEDDEDDDGQFAYEVASGAGGHPADYYPHPAPTAFAPISYYDQPSAYGGAYDHHPHGQHYQQQQQQYCQTVDDGGYAPAPVGQYPYPHPHGYYAGGPQHTQQQHMPYPPAAYHHRPALPTPAAETSSVHRAHYFAPAQHHSHGHHHHDGGGRHPHPADEPAGATSSFYAMSGSLNPARSAGRQHHPHHHQQQQHPYAYSGGRQHAAHGHGQRTPVLPPVSSMYHSPSTADDDAAAAAAAEADAHDASYDYLRSPEVFNRSAPVSAGHSSSAHVGLGLGVQLDGNDRVRHADEDEHASSSAHGDERA